MTSSLQSEELVASLLEQLAPIVPYDTATLWLRNKDRLAVAAAVGFPDTERRLGLAIAVSDSALFNEMMSTGRAMAVGDVREDPRFPRVEIPRLSWLGIPLISKGHLDGVIALEKWQAYFYHPDYVQLATTFASQAVISLENARLYEDSLSRAAELDRRSQRLALLNRFSSQLSGLLDPDQILGLTAEEMLRALSVDRVSTVILERGRAIWRMTTPALNYTLPRVLPDAPIFERLRESLGVFSSNDVEKDADLAQLGDLLEGTTSLLVLPLISGSELRALLFAHMKGAGHIGVNEMELARTVANQAAIALENARLYESSVRTAERLEILNVSGAEISTSLEPEQIYAAVHKAAQRVVPAESFSIILFDQLTNEIESVYVMERGSRLPASRLPKSYGLTSRVLDSGQPVLTSTREESSRLAGLRGATADGPVSILAVPMALGGRVAGMLSVQSDDENAFVSEDLQILGTLANQAIVSIQNGRLFAEIQGLAQGLEQRVIERTAQLQHEQQNTETLLRILTEVSSSLDLDRALNRTLSLLNDVTGAEQGTIMLLQPEDNLLHFRAGYGYLLNRVEPTNTRGFTLKVGEGLAGWVVQNREAVLVDDLRQDSRWVQSASAGQEHRSSIVAPLLVGEDVIGVLMIFHRNLKYFNPDILNLVKAIASQVAVAINNAHLYELIRDQAERLGIMLRKEQEDTSRSLAILEAVADGVLVTGGDNSITFVNASLGRILDIKPGNIRGKPVEFFGGIFGRPASSWTETVRHWSEDPGSVRQGETYAEQLELENGRIALIHLSPVIFQNDFLGTVSIFRDITHEVEVDRLKSEFVATVSHELRTPMTSIKGYVDLLMMGAAGAFNEKQAHFLDIVRNNAARLNVLVNDLLDISRIDEGNITLTPLPLDLRTLAEDVIEDFLRRSREEAKPMAVSLDAPRDLPRVLGDSDRVRQIIANLMDNAYRYTPENGIIRVQISPVDGREVQVDIEDNGVGIALQEQDRIFERFYRGEDPMVLATPGTGLGLPIVRQLVEMHHGRIWMSSKGVPGEGSTFSFTLPVQGTN
jgi:signal transduction histidine kinase/GAF domain-containing protein